MMSDFRLVLVDSEPDITVVGEADTAPAAIQMVSQFQPDIVLMGIRLSDQSGIASC